MIEQCAWCGRLRVRREPNPVTEGEPAPGPTTGVAWLQPANQLPLEGGGVSHGICPRCAKQMELQAEASAAFPANKPDLGAWPGHGAAGFVADGDKTERETHRIADSGPSRCRRRRQNEEATDG